MKTNKNRLMRIGFIVIPILLLIAVMVRLKHNKDKTDAHVYQFNKEKEIAVMTDTIKLSDAIYTSEYTGTFEPNKESKISAEMQGKVIAVYVEAGTFVKQGQPLVQLDNSLLKLQLQSAELQVSALEADVRRYKVLATADAIQAVQLEKAELGLAVAIVQRDILQEQIDKTTIVAPFTGVVTQKLTEIGAFAAPGVPLIQLTDIATLRFTIWVPENRLPTYHVGKTQEIVADIYPNWTLNGIIEMVGSKSNTGNSFPIQFSVANTNDMKIKAGMFGKVKTKLQEGKQRIIIPSSSIIDNGSSVDVYLIKEGKATLRTIQVEQQIKNKIIVASGLSEGDVIITGGFINLFDGANVKPL